MKTRTPITSIAIICILLSTFFLSPQKFPAVASVECARRVDGSAPAGGNGLTWETAYNDLQTAISAAAGVAPCDVWVKAGTYKPGGSVTSRFEMRNNVGIYGGFDGTENSRTERSWLMHKTILSGEIGDLFDASDNVYNVIYVYYITGVNSILDGFTITKGYADDPTYLYSNGGGIYMTQSNMTFSNLKIEYNHSESGGGGVYLSHSTAVFNDTNFSYNTSMHSGAGFFIYQNSNVTLNNVAFAYNDADSRGGGLYKVNFANSLDLNGAIFQENHANYGGGAYIYGSATMDNVSFDSNHADGQGGGMYIDSEASVPNLTMTNSSFVFNGANDGAGVYIYNSSPTFTDVLVAKNTATSTGGGVAGYGYQSIFTNATFAANTAPTGAGLYNSTSSNPVLRNSILWGNIGGLLYNLPSGSFPSTTTLTYSLAQGCNPGGVWNTAACGTDGGNNLVDTDPLFADPLTYLYHLQMGSPVQDKGNDAFISGVSYDLYGQSRIVGSHVDLGPYELMNYRVTLPLIFR